MTERNPAPPAPAKSLRQSLIVKWLVGLGSAAGILLVYLVMQASANTSAAAQSYPWVLGLSGVVAVSLFALIGYQITGLLRKLKNRVFGALLTLRLTVVFALMALIPGALLYIVAAQFLQRSLDSWFDVRIDQALEGGLNLARGALDVALLNEEKRTEVLARNLGSWQLSLAHLQQLRRDAQVDLIAVFAEDESPILLAQDEKLGVLPKSLPREVIRAALLAPVKSKEDIPERGIFLRVVRSVPMLEGDRPMVLMVLTQLDSTLARDAAAVERGSKDYAELQLARPALKQFFALTLTLTVLLTLFSAIALSFVLSERLSAPLASLAEATRAVAAGDFSVVKPVASRDEFGMLTQSFNTMTSRIADARVTLEAQRAELEEGKHYLESILARLRTGVLTFDDQLNLRASNQSAWSILGIAPERVSGQPLALWHAAVPEAAPWLALVTDAFRGTDAAAAEGKDWQRELPYVRGDSERRLLVRGTRFVEGEGDASKFGYVVVMDDVTRLAAAQRAAAWGEVARRLAHEIKNPLTPIQLSAERLEHKLSSKLIATADRELLSRATQTIVNQVTVLKGMVNDFSLYAKASRIVLAPVALNQLIEEVLALYEASAEAHSIEVRLSLAPDLPLIEADAAMLRQVIHNLLQNATDALLTTPAARITVTTQLAPNSPGRVLMSVQDNGPGFSETVRARAFEPYVTSKPKGTGLGLAIVKKIVEEHGGTIEVLNEIPNGAKVALELPVVPLNRGVPVSGDNTAAGNAPLHSGDLGTNTQRVTQ